MKTITNEKRLALIGLLALGDYHNRQLKEIEKAMLKITGEKAEYGGGHCSDALYGVDEGPDKVAVVDGLLERLSITIDNNDH